MPLLPPYITGTISVAAGGTTVTGTDTLFTNSSAREGDWLRDPATGYVTVILARTDATHLTVPAWRGTALTGAAYEIYPYSPLRFAGADAMADVKALFDILNGATVFYIVTGAAPDPSLGEEGQMALKTNSGAWQQWVKTGGEWIFLGIPVGTNYRGTWYSAATYGANDLVTLNGAAYIAKAASTNQQPPNATYWDVFAQAGAKGDRGNTWTSGTVVPSNATGQNGDQFVLRPLWDVYERVAGVWSKTGSIRGVDGGSVTIPYTFDSLTAPADPGNGKVRLNQATQNTSTSIYADLLDNRGIDFTAVLDALGGGSSAAKQIVRIYRADDQTRFILARITAVGVATGFRSLACEVFGASSANPFTNGDALVIAFAPVGDKGDSITGPQGVSYRERVYDPAVTYVNNATFIDRVIHDGQTWTCLLSSVTGVTPGTDPTRWGLASRGVSPTVIDAAVAARDQALAAQAAVEGIQDDIDATAAQVASDRADAETAASNAEASATAAAGSADTVEGLIDTALAIAAQAADDGDADDETGSAATVDDGDADI